MAVNPRATSMVSENYYAAFKCYMGTGFFFVSTPFLLVRAAAAAVLAAVVGEVDQKVASMRLKIGQPVAYGLALIANTIDLLFSKVLWV